MSTMLEYDEQTAWQVEAIYTTPVEQRRAFRALLALQPGAAGEWAEELVRLDDRYFFSLNRYAFVAVR